MRLALSLLLLFASSTALARDNAASDFSSCVVHDVEAQFCYLRCSGTQTLKGTLSVTSLITTGTAAGVSGISASSVKTYLGSYSASGAALWLSNAAPTSANYTLSNFGPTDLNTVAGQVIQFQVAGVTKATMDANGGFSSVSAVAPQWSCTGASACELRSASAQTARVDCGGGTCTTAIGDGSATTVVIGRSGQTSTINGSGAFGTREFLVDKVSSGIGAGNLLATGTNYSGYKLPQAWTLTHLSINVTTASTATVANTVFTATDGTNTCTFTYACNTVTNTTGVKDVAAVNGAGTGCVYAAAALVTLSVTTQGCATAATVNSISTWGKPQ